MNLALIASGFALLALPGWTGSLGRRLAPHEWARLTAASLWTGLFAVRLGLLVTGAPTLLRTLGVDGLAEACHRTFGPITPGGTISGVASAAALVALQSRLSMARLRSRRLRRGLHVEPWLGDHHTMGDHELVVVPTTSTVAYALEGRPPQVVVSSGLTTSLTDTELGAVLCHERCHLEHGHQRHLDLAIAIDAALPPIRSVRRSTATLRLALERWADEAAATHLDRATLRGALAKVVDGMLAKVAVPAFTSAETILERLDALDTTPQRASTGLRLAAAGPAVALAATVAATAFAGSGPIHHSIFNIINLCPM